MKAPSGQERAFCWIVIGVLSLSCHYVIAEPSGSAGDGGGSEHLPNSRCLWLRQPGPVPGLLTHRTEQIDLMRPVSELLHEVFLVSEANIREHDLEGFVWADDPETCILYGDPVTWAEYKHALGAKFRAEDKLIMSSLISNRGGDTVCVSDDIISSGAKCKTGFDGMKEEENILFLGEIQTDSVSGAYLNNKGKTGYIFDMYQFGDNSSEQSRFVCKQTGISKAHFGLLKTLKSAIREYVKLTSSLEFEKSDQLVEDCPNLLSTAILRVKGDWEFGDTVNHSRTVEVQGICDDIWNNHYKRSILNYLFEDNYGTIQGILSSTNLNIKNIRVLDQNLRGYVSWNNKVQQATKFVQQGLQNELSDIKKTLTLLINFNILEKFETARHNNRVARFELLFSIFNRAESLVIESRRLLEKVMRGLSEDSMCALDTEGKISCQQDAGLLSLKDHTITITTKARKLEIKTVSQANCLFLDNGELFEGQDEIFVYDGDFFHSTRHSVPINCATKMKDDKYSCKQYFSVPRDGGKGPDQLSKDVFYILTPKGVLIQNMGSPTKLVYGRGEESIILTKEPSWIKKKDFPIQIAGGKNFEFDSLVTVSSEINLNFKILHYNRNKHFDYSKFKELHKATLKSVTFEKLYGSFTQLFRNNFAVRIVSVTGVTCAIILLLVVCCFIYYCCSHGKQGNRRYLRYSRRTGGAVISGDPRPPVPSAPQDISEDTGKESRRRRRDTDPENRKLDRLQRLLNRL